MKGQLNGYLTNSNEHNFQAALVTSEAALVTSEANSRWWWEKDLLGISRGIMYREVLYLATAVLVTICDSLEVKDSCTAASRTYVQLGYSEIDVPRRARNGEQLLLVWFTVETTLI